MLMFALELQRRSDKHGWGLISTAAHPGFSRTNLMHAPTARAKAWVAKMARCHRAARCLA